MVRSKKSRQRRDRGHGTIESMATSSKQVNWNSRTLVSKVMRSPFPPIFNTTFSFPREAVEWHIGARSSSAVFKLNSLFDFDYSNVIGNNQPVYYDQLLSSTGPYTRYRVKSWRLKLTVINITGFGTVNSRCVQVVYGQGQLANTDVDTFAECIQQPNAQVQLLQWYGGAEASTAVCCMNGSVDDFIPRDSQGDDFQALFNADPVRIIYGYLAVQNTDGASAICDLAIQPEIEIDAELFTQDAIPS